MVKFEEVKALKVPELKEELKLLGLDVKGVKADLVKRLEDALTGQGPKSAVQTPSTAAASGASGDKAAVGATHQAPASNGKVAIEFKAPGATALAGISKLPAVPVAAAKATDSGPAKQSDGLSEFEKRKQRAERFGGELPQADKLKSRAERFGLGSQTAPSGTKVAPQSEAEKAADLEKRKERAKRFNLPVPTTAAEEAEKKKARLDRFGSQAAKAAGSPAAANGDLQKKLAERAERFALGNKPQAAQPQKSEAEMTEAEKKRQARAIKFAPNGK